MQTNELKHALPNSILLAAIIFVVAMSVIFVALPFFHGDVSQFIEPTKAPGEIYKLALSAVLGGVVALLFRAWEQNRQRRIAEQALLQDFHHRFIIAYNTAKKARRMLRARSKNESGHWSIDLNSYDEIMSKLEDAQLEFEALRRASHAKKPALEPHYEEISGKLSRAEKYLRSVLREYEINARNENVPLDGVTLPFFVSSEDAEKHSIDDRERVDTEFFFLVDDVENKLIGLILQQYTQPPASLTPTQSSPAASTSRRRRRG